MSTKKQRTLKAVRDLEEKYRFPDGQEFFNADFCALCHIHNTGGVFYLSRCIGCPLAAEDGQPGCMDFSTYLEAKIAHKRIEVSPRARRTFNARADFFKKIYPILEAIPPERFTKRGWKYFNELDRSW